MSKLMVNETYVNETEGYQYGDSGFYEAYTDDKGRLFRSCQDEYGRCVSSMYRDFKDGRTEKVGWVFEKKVEYEDANRYGFRGDKQYLRQVWVEVREAEETEDDE